jgi:hypothetical protein
LVKSAKYKLYIREIQIVYKNLVVGVILEDIENFIQSVVKKFKITGYTARNIYNSEGQETSIKVFCNNIGTLADCPKELKTLKYSSIIEMSKAVLKAFSVIGLPNAEVEKVKTMKNLSKQYLVSNNIVPFMCPVSGRRYFFSATLNKVVPCSSELYRKTMGIDEIYFNKMTQLVPLHFNPKMNEGIMEGLSDVSAIVCHTFDPFVFD